MHDSLQFQYDLTFLCTLGILPLDEMNLARGDVNPSNDIDDDFNGNVVGREDDAQPAGALRMAGGEDLGDHPAHRRAHDVHAFDAEVVEHRGGVVGHVLEGVHRFAAQAGTPRCTPGRETTPDRVNSHVSAGVVQW